jgi:hypothetical protein
MAHHVFCWCTQTFFNLSLFTSISSSYNKFSALFTIWSPPLKNLSSMEAHRLVRRQSSHIVLAIGSQMAVRSVSRAGLPLPTRKIPSTHFRPQSHSTAGRLRSIEKSNDLIGNRTRDLPACSRVPQQTVLPHAQFRQAVHEFASHNFTD